MHTEFVLLKGKNEVESIVAFSEISYVYPAQGTDGYRSVIVLKRQENGKNKQVFCTETVADVWVKLNSKK